MAMSIFRRAAFNLPSGLATISQHSQLAPRAELQSNTTTTSSTNNPQQCINLRTDQIIISRTTCIITLTIFSLMTFFSLLLICALIYRTYHRRKQTQAARTWGRKSRFDNRISMLRKEIDDSYTRQYGPGCWMNPIPENPEMGSDSPVEIGTLERVWEVPAVAKKEEGDGGRRKIRAKSLFFDYGMGVWMPKR